MSACRLTVPLSLVIAGAFAAGLAAGPGSAAAEDKPKRRIIHEQVYAPSFFERIPGVRTLFGDYALTEDEYNALYGPDGRGFDESYYEPEPAAPAKPKTKPAAKPAAKAQAAKPATAKPKPSAEQKTAKAAPGAAEPEAAPKTSQAAAVPAKPSPTALSCEKATGIVSDYGFTGVTAQSCQGKVYAFNATRGGKNFAIKLDPASGELTEVKKLQ